MFYKCNHCDPSVRRGEKPIRTIDTENHLFLKDDKNKYYHSDCYKIFLRNKTKLSEDEIKSKIDQLSKKSEMENKENSEKDKFLKWIMNFYDSSLPSYFLKKLNNIRIGEYEGLNEPITYSTMLDIYSHMDNYLRNIAAKKKLNDVTHRMNYDLAVVVGNYGNYKKFKAKQVAFSVDSGEIDKQIKVDTKVVQVNRKTTQIEANNEDEFDLNDVMNELLL